MATNSMKQLLYKGVNFHPS